MTSESNTRREFLRTLPSGSVILLGLTPGRAEEREQEVPATEDLMREHGVLNRVLLIYEEAVRRLEAKQDLAWNGGDFGPNHPAVHQDPLGTSVLFTREHR